jgi:NhaA family Na+:H+ antiporter
MRTFIDNSGLLVVGTLLALLWANLAHDGYEQIASALRFTVNDIGMAFFFALAAKEIVEATSPGGPLHSLRRAGLPLIAAIGGMIGPALLYLSIVTALDRPDLARGWAIPCVTDIAFSYLAARLIFGPVHPAIPFLLLLAIADDALGLLIIAVFYPTTAIRLADFTILLGAAMAVAWWLRQRHTSSFWPYIAGAGVISWLAFYRGGLHPALALVPVVPFLPRAQQDAGLFVESASDHDTLSEFEHRWKFPVQIILFFFAFVNAGVALGSVGAGTWAVLAAIVVGKPIGILASTALGVATGLQKPVGVTWRDLTILGMIAGIGFTVALFFATASFPPGDLLDQTKMGALLSISAAALAGLAALLLRAGRWARL